MEKKAAVYVAALHGATGSLIGLLVGLWVWLRWDLRLRWLAHSDVLDNWLSFAVIVGGFTVIFTVLAACLKERFWEDWRCPFWWS